MNRSPFFAWIAAAMIILQAAGLAMSAAATLDDGLVAYYNGSLVGDRVIDIFSNRDVGSSTLITTNQSFNIYGGAFNFTTTGSSYMTVDVGAWKPNSINQSNFTLAFWFKMPQAAQMDVIAHISPAGQNDLGIDFATGGTAVSFQLDGTRNDGGDESNLTNQWGLLAVRVNTNETGTYPYFNVNDVRILSNGNPGTMANVNNFTFGCSGDVGNTCTVGINMFANTVIDEIAVWDRSLNDSEVKQLYGNVTNATFCNGDPCSFAAAPPPSPCTYGGSGDFSIPASNNCTVTSNYNLAGSDLAITNNTGCGTITLEANVTNAGNASLDVCTKLAIKTGSHLTLTG